MKSEAVNSREKIFNFAKNYSLRLIFMKVAYFVAAVLISRGSIFSTYYPFGVSLSAAVPGKGVAPTIAGVLLGCLFPLRLSLGVRYFSAALSVAAIRWTLSDLPKVKNHFLYTPLLVFFSSLITGIAINSADGFDGREMLASVLESLVAAGAAYFFNSTFKILCKKKIYALTAKEFTCVSVSAGVALLALSGITLGGVSLGHVLAIAMILIFAYCGGVSAASLIGTTTGVVLSLPCLGTTYVPGAYAFGGMIAGFFCHFGKIGVCAAFLIVSTLMSFQTGDVTKMIIGLYESVIAIVAFLVLPSALLAKVKSVLPCFSVSPTSQDFKAMVVQRLKIASDSLASVPLIACNAFLHSSDSAKNSSDGVCMSSAYEICKKCGLCTFCWSNQTRGTHDNLAAVIDLISKNQEVTYKSFSQDFLRRCHKTDVLIDNMIRAHTDFMEKKDARMKAQELGGVMCEQFDAVGALIKDVSQEIFDCYDFDSELAKKIELEFTRTGIKPLNVMCKKDKFKKLFVQIKYPAAEQDKVTSSLTKKIIKICARAMSEPCVTTLGDIHMMRLCEKKIFTVDFGLSQHAFNNGKDCGDSCCNFEDGTGKFNVIISDGMGTGGSAAAQGALTARVMKSFVGSGMGFDSSVKFVNSALLMNQSEECLSTLDAFSVDLFSGEAKIMKAGSPATFIIRNGEVEKINLESLPIGILSKVSFSCQTFKLCEGDYVVMLSDGATDIGDMWITDVIKSYKFSNAKELSKIIVKTAVSLRRQTHDDDITAAVIGFSKASGF